MMRFLVPLLVLLPSTSPHRLLATGGRHVVQATPKRDLEALHVGRGAGRYLRGDLHQRPTASSYVIVVASVSGALFGGMRAARLGCMPFEGVLLGSGALWMAASFGDAVAERMQMSVARRRFAAEARERDAWIARAEAAEQTLAAATSASPISLPALEQALSEVEPYKQRFPLATRRAAALLELLERTKQHVREDQDAP